MFDMERAKKLFIAGYDYYILYAMAYYYLQKLKNRKVKLWQK
jgi:hypothetical protein